jgi:hypothetical protein
MRPCVSWLLMWSLLGVRHRGRRESRRRSSKRKRRRR